MKWKWQLKLVGQLARYEKAIPPPPPPTTPYPLPRFWVATNPALMRKIATSVTNEEIVKFWRQKSVEVEDHLLSAIKAAARVRARNLTGDDYKHFEESLKEEDALTRTSSKKDMKDLRVGIKDWWTKSKHAYLNQPPMESTSIRKRQNSA